jgi:release factor family 2
MQLGFLSPLFDRSGPWASVYVDTRIASEDAAARQELTARGAAERLQNQGADARTCRVVQDALAGLDRSGHPPGRALFAHDGEIVLDTALTAPPPGGGADACWEALPHVGPLIDLVDDEGSCLVAYVDRTGADFALRGPLGTQDAGRLDGEDWPVHRTPTGDWSERKFQNAVENTWEHNAASIARAIEAKAAETGAETLVLAGDRRECRAVHDRLPRRLRERTVEARHGSRAAGGNAEAGHRLLDEEVEDARAEHLRHHVTEVMDDFLARRVPSDEGTLGAAEGVPALVEAAREHRIGTLLLRPDGADLHREVWVGPDTDQLAVRRNEVHYLGESEPWSARADDALLRSAAMTGAEVLRIPADDPGARTPAGGLGALLRWPYGGAPEGGGEGGGQHATRQ